jgi:hypothetical protein
MKTTYTTTEINSKGYTYSVTVVSGKFNYVSIKQKNHVRGLGKEFLNFDEAVKYYNSAEMKVELLKIEMGLIPYTRQFAA